MATFDLPPFLIKFGAEKDINRLVYEGSMKFGTFEEYRKEPLDSLFINQPGRYDKLEGLEKQYSGKAKFKFGSNSQSVNVENATIKIFQNKFKHIFCAYAASHYIPKNFSIDPRMKEYFGDYAVVFNSKSFLIHIANLLHGIKFDMGFVKYYPKEVFYNNLGPFTKRDNFNYQYEYRIATNLSNEILNIGDFLRNQPDTIITKSDDLLKAKFLIK